MKVHKLSNVTVFVETTVLKISKELSRKFFEVLGHAVATRTHENNTKLLTAEFTKKIVVLKKYRKFGIYCILKQDQNIQIFETI
ncbi:hypothetical protein [Leptospira interrogans]|uniref:hypothetical protein n=2 Tax=Leptospira interrogans TaxID=173 RepID=UPI00051BA1AD|nr:hypothetical protein [Leptospira interrogans]